MKSLLIAMASVFALDANAAVYATCVSKDGTEALSYRDDGNFEHAKLNGIQIGKAELLPQGKESSPTTHTALGLKVDVNEALFQYPLANGRTVVIAWSVDPMQPEQMTEGFSADVKRMELRSEGKVIATYTGCKKAR